jgi:3,5-epimerase/4-reductase
MKILIYGGHGWLGRQIINELNLLNISYIIGKERVDINYIKLEEEILKINPTHIYSCIGRTHSKTINSSSYLDNSDTLHENIRDNLYSPITLSIISKKLSIHYTYIGTGCIFQYDKTHNIENNVGFTEYDIPNFYNSNYSLVKGYTDRLMQLFDNTLNVRIRMPITTDLTDERNFLNKLINFKYIQSMYNSWSVLPELLPIMIDMTIKKHTGTINLVNPGIISHNDILTQYKDIIDNKFEWINFENEELLHKKSNNYLDTTKLKTLYPNVLDIKSSLIKTLINIKCKTSINDI